jgi:hypothetical protein
MPDGLTLRTTALLVVFAFGLTFSVQTLLRDRVTPPKPRAKPSAARFEAAAPRDRQPAAGSLPVLREPRQRRAHRKPKHTVRKVVKPAPRLKPARVTSRAPVQPVPTAAPVQPVPTAAPRYAPPARTTPAPTPAPVAPRHTPASGEFDSSGESDTSGEFDTSGEP